MLTEEQVSAFAKRGFVVLPGFFSAAEITAISDWLDALRRSAPGNGHRPDGDALYFERSPIDGSPVLVRAEHVVGPHNAAMSELLLGPSTRGCLEALLGEHAVLFKEKVNYKLPGCRADKLHQDQAAGWDAYAPLFATMAIAVDENRADNAALSFRDRDDHERRLLGEPWKPLSEEDPPYEPAADYTLVEAKPGDVIVFDSYVPHGSPPNTSARPRRNVYLTFNRASDGDLRDRYYAEKWLAYPPNAIEDLREASSYRV